MPDRSGSRWGYAVDVVLIIVGPGGPIIHPARRTAAVLRATTGSVTENRRRLLPSTVPGALRMQGDAMRIFSDDTALEALCRRYGIRRLSLFGSALKGTSRPDSDVDLLVEFQPAATPSLFTMAEIELALSPLLGGRKVDLRTAGDLSRYFRDEVVRMAEPQYEA